MTEVSKEAVEALDDAIRLTAESQSKYFETEELLAELRRRGFTIAPIATPASDAPWTAESSDERIKRLMKSVGMPDSQSLYQAFKQCENELCQQYAARATGTGTGTVRLTADTSPLMQLRLRWRRKSSNLGILEIVMTEVSKEAVEALIRSVQNVDETIELDLIDATAIAFELQSQGFTIAPIAPVTDEKLREAWLASRGTYADKQAFIDKYRGQDFVDVIVSALSELAQLRAETKLMATRYEVGNELTIERASHRPDTWAIRKYGYCMAKDGKFEYEPMPSNRDAAFLERCRFNSLSAAVAALPTPPKEDL